MRGIPATVALSLVLMAGPALAQEGHEGMRHDGEKAGHGEMRMHEGGMHGGMTEMLAAHAEELGLSTEQVERFEALDQRFTAEKERHHAEVRAIHEAAMEILTDEQRDRLHARMESMHGGAGHGAHGDAPEGHDGHDPPSEDDEGDEPGA